MFELFKRLFSKPAAAQVTSTVAVPAPPSVVAALTTPVVSGDVIQLPLTDIIAKLPASLAPVPDARIVGSYALPVAIALEQLPKGAVRIRFGQLRQCAPAGTFFAPPAADDTLIDLPLPKILASINPALLTRKTDQQQISVPDDINGVFSTTKRAPVAPAPSPVAIVSSPTPVPAPVQVAADAVEIPLALVFEFWPEGVRLEIAQSKLRDASTAIPMARLDASMKSGKVTFTWGELLQWLNVSVAAVSSPNRDISLELPLKVVAPLFMAKRAGAVQQKKIVVGDNIPNIFGNLTAVASMPATPAPAPVIATPAPLPESVNKKESTPQEVIRKANALPGVAGSLVAMNDGLLVAGDWPAPFKSDTVAAFLPQMFGRQSHYANEIQLGALTALSVQTGSVACTIVKNGNLFLAVVSQPGHSLPDAQLRALAGELSGNS